MWSPFVVFSGTTFLNCPRVFTAFHNARQLDLNNSGQLSERVVDGEG